MQKQNNDLAIQLIDTTFTKEDAKDVLLALLDHKINFHYRKRFGNMEREGVDRSQSEVRIKELKAEKERVNQYFDSMDAEKISVSSLVHIVPAMTNMESKIA